MPGDPNPRLTAATQTVAKELHELNRHMKSLLVTFEKMASVLPQDEENKDGN